MNRSQILGNRIELLGSSASVDGTVVANHSILNPAGELFSLGSGSKTIITHVEIVYNNPALVPGLSMAFGSQTALGAAVTADWRGTANLVMTTVPIFNGASLVFPDLAGGLLQKAFTDGTLFGFNIAVAGAAGLTFVCNAFGFTTVA